MLTHPRLLATKAWLRANFGAAPPPRGPGDRMRPRGVFRRVLHGDYPLVRAYWLHYLLGYYLYIETQDILVLEVAEHFPAHYELLAHIASYLPATLIWLWLLVGAWMSSRRHVARGGWRGWAIAAQLVLLVNVTVQLTAMPDTMRSLGAQWPLASGQQAAPLPAFWLSDDGQVLILDGVMHEGTSAALERILTRAPGVATLVLSSGGGWLKEGRLVGRSIAAHGLRTHVGSRCTAVCALAFMSGRTRSAHPEAQLGFRGYGPAAGEDEPIRPRRTDSEVQWRSAYGRLGLRSDLFYKLGATPYANLWYPDAAEGVRFDVLTGEPDAALPALPARFTRLIP